MYVLPIAQYPEITPPQVQITANYIGAGCEVTADTTATPLEQQINGTPGMIYMASSCDNTGAVTIKATFEVGYDPSIGAVDILSRVNTAMPQLPDVAQKTGVSVLKKLPQIMMIVQVSSPDGSRDPIFLSNYASIYLVDELKRIPGVSDILVGGERKYSYRIWLDPNRLTAMGLTSQDVVDAVQDQNQDVAGGKVGGPPAREGQEFQYQLNMLGRLEEESQFEDIIIRTNSDGSTVRVSDVGRVELGAQDYSMNVKYNGMASIALLVFQTPDSNAMAISQQVTETLEKASKYFPSGVEYAISQDTTLFVSASIAEVIETLIIAVILVFIVVYVFLQSFRSTLIPAITIPVSLIGTFVLMTALGFSINTLSLLGLVLAIGLVVDDAIVVVENVERLMRTKNMGRFEAARAAMREVTSPIIATSLVLMAVFVPISFMPGVTGELYNQFALTIACSVGISTINSLTLSPALCGILLHTDENKNWFFRKFDQGLNWTVGHYTRSLKFLIRFWWIILLIFALLISFTGWLFYTVPTSFVPEEDQGYFFVLIRKAPATALGKTTESLDQASEILGKMDGVEGIVSIAGYDLTSGAMRSDIGTIFCVLKPWGERTTKETSLLYIASKAKESFDKEIPNAVAIPFNAPAIPGISATGGFEFEILDTADLGMKTLSEVTEEFIKKAKSRPELGPLSSFFSNDTPQLYVDIDRDKVKNLGVRLSDVFQTIQINLGSLYVNLFNKYSRVFRVYVQAEEKNRSNQDSINQLYVRNNLGKMIPLSAFVKIRTDFAPETVSHYNLFPSALINGMPAPGYSSGQAVRAMNELAEEVLPEGMRPEWTGIIYQQLIAGNLAPFVFGLALIFTYLFLSAQYESWVMPMMVMLAVPLAIFGAIGAQWARGLDNDVYCQIGMVMLIGLASKNAILIVEFAAAERKKGKSIPDAVIEAARLRLRPILMTAFSFILGVVPLVIASGAGAAARHSLGTTVFGGMLVSTLLSLSVVPVFYVLLQNMREYFSKSARPKPIDKSDEPAT
jgi:hydrophobe/amphiphile efflux-1 (HAE1) family protein